MISMHYLADLGRLFPLERSLTLYKFFICRNRTQYEELPLDSHCTGHICRRCEKKRTRPRSRGNCREARDLLLSLQEKS